MLWIWDNRSFNTVDQSNRDKMEAERAYEAKNYPEAASLYRKITYGSIFSEPASRLYLAHTYFHLDSLDLAEREYKLLTHVSNASIASVAETQLGLLACRAGDSVSALNHLKTALRLDPLNQTARYDYQILKTVFSGKVPDAPTAPPPAVPSPSPPPSTTIEQQTVELAEKREELLERLRRLNMSEEQARSILDAMKSNEAQYIYQLRRRQYYDQSERSKVVEW
ncbi:hypothetical protein [Persicitalea jodogahamensis]|uniref:Tetratricopeptide repeat protein n=1 Tax=Persicitalea jodogahamensis TaxID=402147 RepID=A0A8J3GA75_9BACT|nr:hypothetical protein [Persicitalea jodogahamensis]GHB78736.1 hypothetical protein GCM10007390_36430 [Persicitalea jodogahamensis]